MNPLISIVLPSYNSEKTIKRPIESVFNQTFSNWELIIVDDYSTDQTINIINGYKGKDKRIKVILNDHNWGGPAKPRNQGINVAKGEWIAFLDADDWWYKNKLQQCILYFDTADVIYHDLDIYVKKDKKKGKIRGRKLYTPVFFNLLKNINSVPNSSSLVKKEILKKVGGLSEEKDLIAVEDFDLWIRISLLTEKFKYLNKTLGAYWFGGGNITQVSDRQIEKLENLQKRYLNALSDSDKKEATWILHYSIGRIKQYMGQEKIAIMHFKKSIRRKKLEIKLKSFYLIITLNIRLLFRRR